ncbi:hypothetical protein KM043_007554 [Ampulex compressa]|nr:hypothetical protein KM043_007554 [Ampulex compressa]
MEPDAKVPLPLEPIRSNQVEDRRLWVGNLDLRINDSTSCFIGLDHKLDSRGDMPLWAHCVTESDIDKPKPKIDIPALAGAKKEDKRISRETAIQAIEAKLKLMNESEEEFELNKPLNGSPVINLYQRAENQKPSTSMRYYNRGGHYHNSKPYGRYKPRR